MSDRLSSVEIEDVLSSIRRLVSDDLRPKTPAEAGKLILTPALRVVSDVPDAQQDMVPEAPFAVVSDDDAHGIEETVASIGAAVPDDGYEPETGDMSLDGVLPVPEWPESTWAAPENVDAVDSAEVISLMSADTSAVEDDAMRAWADEAEAEVVASLQDEERAFPAGLAFDEEVLRDLVRDLIREELQGALGERITRNVRKLVRSELNRVLAVTDFE